MRMEPLELFTAQIQIIIAIVMLITTTIVIVTKMTTVLYIVRTMTVIILLLDSPRSLAAGGGFARGPKRPQSQAPKTASF